MPAHQPFHGHVGRRGADLGAVSPGLLPVGGQRPVGLPVRGLQPQVVVLPVDRPLPVGRRRVPGAEGRRRRVGAFTAVVVAPIEFFTRLETDAALVVEVKRVERQLGRREFLFSQAAQRGRDLYVVERRLLLAAGRVDGDEFLAPAGKLAFVPEAVFCADPVGRDRIVEHVSRFRRRQEAFGAPVVLRGDHRLRPCSRPCLERLTPVLARSQEQQGGCH